MECPKCKTQITDDMLVCPNCKKVLKLVCPKCKTINKSNTCKKCGFVIISKCHNCGKINQTINNKCSKCGFSTYTSVSIANSNIDEFACITLEFSNIEIIKKALGSTKLTDKFKANLDNLISEYVRSIGSSREIVNNIYVIRCNKDLTFGASCNTAIKAAIEIANLITELNVKLQNFTKTALSCNIAILKRDIYSTPNQYKSGFDIKLIYQNKKNLKLLNNLQIITDSYIYERICDEYDLTSLSAKFIKNEMMTFFELNLKKYVKIKPLKEKEDDTEVLPELPILTENKIVEENAKEIHFYGAEAISFNEIKCKFESATTLELIEKAKTIFSKNDKQILSIKGKEEFYLQTEDFINAIEKTGKFKNIYRVTCYDEMKYRPYGFFYELLSGIYEFSISPKNFETNDFNIFRKLDKSGFIKSLVNLEERKFPHPEDVRFSLFDIFFNIIKNMSGNLIFIENFEKIDDTSLEILQMIFEKFDEFHLSFLILADKDYSLHKNSYFLLGKKNYTELRLKPTYVKDIIGNKEAFTNILDSYYIRTIVQNTRGSLIYFEHAMNYLLERHLITTEEGKFKIEDFENIFIPPNLSELLTKRIHFLSKKDNDAYKLLCYFVMLGPKTDLLTLNKLKLQNIEVAIEKLVKKCYIYIFRNTLYIQNYNILRNAVLISMTTKLKQEISQDLITKVFSTQIKHPAEIEIYKNLEQQKQEFLVWEKLSHVNASMGDFSAYLHCSINLLKLLENNINNDSQKTIEDYKLDVYENISNLLYKYMPNEIYNISKIILDKLEKNVNLQKVISLSNKMLQGCLLSGNYSYALELLHKILSKYQNVSLNPNSENFNISYFLISLIKIEILFSIGKYKDCEEAGEEILENITLEILQDLKPKHLSQKQFEDVLFDSFTFTAFSKILLLRSDENIENFILKIQTKMGKISEVFKLFLPLKLTLTGKDTTFPTNIVSNTDKFSKIIISFIKAFKNDRNDYNKFANDIYKAKIEAKANRLSQFELFCDLLIGYSYFKLKKGQKASSIYQNVLETSVRNGLQGITYIAWYLISMMKFYEKDTEIAYGIANNALIQLEKDNNAGDFMFYIFRILHSQILMSKGLKEASENGLKSAEFIKEKYDL